MIEEKFFSGDCIQCSPYCIPFSYAVAIWHKSRLNPCYIINMYNYLFGINPYNEITNEYKKILTMHKNSFNNIQNFFLENNKILDNFNKALSSLRGEYINRGQEYGTDVSEHVSSIKCCKTAMICINGIRKDNNVSGAHSIAVTYDSANNRFISRDPNSNTNCCFNDLKSVAERAALRLFRPGYYIGDMLLFWEREDSESPNELA